MAGLEIAEQFLDPEVSARTVPLHKRDGGARMMDYIRANGIKHIITARLDRIFRSSLDGHAVMETLKGMGCDLHFADQNGCSINTRTAVGQMIFSVLLAFAEFEPRITAERTSRALKHKAAKGERVSSKIMFGRCLDPENPKMTIVCEQEQDTIREMMRLQIQGLHPKKIARALNRRRLLCRGKTWSTRMVSVVIGRQLAALQPNNPC